MTDEFLPETFREHLATPTPARLFHYTSQVGLLGIIEHKELWCTNARYMNDSAECLLAWDLARCLLRSRHPAPSGTSTGPWVPNTQQHIQKHPSVISLTQLEELDRGELMSSIETIGESDQFTACFCEGGDLLNQWRGYAHGGRGYAIAFDPEDLRSAAEKKGFQLGKCIYDKGTQRKIVREAIDHCIENVSSATSTSGRGNASTLADILVRCGPFFKDAAFSEEQEWRLLSPNIGFKDDALRFREGRSAVIPYYNLCIEVDGKTPIRHVVVGPCPDMNLSQRSVKRLLISKSAVHENHYDELVVKSEISFRDW